MDAAAGPLRVLHVEDDRVSALVFSQVLRGEPQLDLRSAEDGAEALALAADGRWLPEVLVLDAHLPDTSGHVLLARLRALPGLAAVPAFMCSADSAPDDQALALAAGFTACWPKPVVPAQLLAALLALHATRN